MLKDLIVSCQALEDEPLHSSFIMSKMALAAYQGGANGIRANSVADIRAIKEEIDLPIIGIIKQDYEDSEVMITPTLKEIKALYEEGVDVIAFDATDRLRPGGETLPSFMEKVKEHCPGQTLMADISTVQEAVNAELYGVDIVATTLVGYTSVSQDDIPLQTLKEVVKSTNLPVIAEGNLNTPEKAKEALDIGASAVVVGSAITRPKYITETFSTKIIKSKEREEQQ